MDGRSTACDLFIYAQAIFYQANANTTIYDVKLTIGTNVSAALVLLALRALPCVALCCPAFVLCVPVGMS